MNFLQFKEKFFKVSVFTTDQVYTWYPNFDRNNFSRWNKRGLIIRLRKGVFTFPEYKSLPHYIFYVANKIYKPSYISLHSALAFYGFIPESILQTTSVTTLKTESFINEAGEFSYKTFKKSLMFGYQQKVIDNEKYFLIASPEKALIDLFYLYPELNNEKDVINLRFDEALIGETIKKDLLFEMVERINSNALLRRIKIFIKVNAL